MDQRLELVTRLIRQIQDKESSRKNVSLAERSAAEEFRLYSMVKVEGGQLPASSQLGPVPVDAFYIARTTVTLAEWRRVRNWAEENAYNLGDVGAGKGLSYPVINVNWYDTLKWCNARSEMEGLTPVYSFRGEVYRRDELTPVVELLAGGYRLPSEKEWEFAARGGVESKDYEYSGSNDIDTVAWYRENSGPTIHEVATKQANELGIFDMSGNVWEWCYDALDVIGTSRIGRGGGYNGLASVCRSMNRGAAIATGSALNFGFRVTRNSVP
jgi:formylglycine-generating enzyme required for sulfatase activity